MSAKRQTVCAIAPRDGAQAIRLHGYSGARLLLVRRGGTYTVRKTAGSPAQNARLLAQVEQQRLLFFSGIAVPRIYESGLDASGHAFFEMEYVPGQSVANMIAEARPLDPDPVAHALARLFDFLRLTASGDVPAERFAAKISQIAACDSAVCRAHATAVAAMAERLARRDWTRIAQSSGHGDLTLENMLVSPGRGLVFIDCDACFASSYWLDAGKLFQDVAGHWCLRGLYGRGGPALVNAVQQMHVLERPLARLVAQIDPGLPARLPQLAAFHLFRTLPYIRETAVADFVLARMDALLS